MGIHNLNPRRVVWFSPNEPSNKYDIWLSRNAHLDENGEPTTDSNSQRDCDYIFKIYDCGKWNPIVGFNSTAANKIDCVEGNHLNHPALFTGTNPNDLKDDGSFTYLFSQGDDYVDWGEVIQNGSLGDEITNHMHNEFDAGEFDLDIEKIVQVAINEGDITIGADDIEGLNIDFATLTDCGGILADTHSDSPNENRRSGVWVKFVSTDNSTYDRTYGAQIPQHHLAITGQQIIDTVRAWYENEYDGEGVIPDDNIPDQLYSWFRNSPSIMKGWQESSSSLGGNKPRFEIWGAQESNAGKILKLKDAEWWQGDHPTGVQDPYTPNHNAIEWIDPSELSTYTLEVASTSALGGIKAATHASAMLPEAQVAECKFYNPSSLSQSSYKRQALCIDIKDVKNALDAWYASEDSNEWDVNLKASYGIVARKQEFVDNNNNTVISYTHSLSNYGQYTKEGMYCRTKFYNTSSQQQGNRDYSYNDGHGLEWISGSDIIKEGTGYPVQAPNDKKYLACTAGVFSWEDEPSGGGSTGIDSLNETNYRYQGDYTINVPQGGTGGNNYFLNGKGGWTPITIPTYTNFIGATQSQNGQNGFVPAPTAGQQNYVLTGLRGNNNAWRPVTDVFNINTQNSVITANGNFTLSDNVLSADYAGNHTDLGTLYPWNYYIISCGKSNTQFNFVISSSRSDTGNPIYIRINTADPMTLSGNIDYINSNDVFTTGTTLAGNSSYLLTIQFKIVKIEKIASTKQSLGGNAEEPAS